MIKKINDINIAVYAPLVFQATLFNLLRAGGMTVVSPSCHGYWKNLFLAMTGKMDNHFTALWDHGHIKFWSIRTLSALLRKAGFGNIRFARVGWIPALVKSTNAVAKKP